jgi:hypothetical protein
MDIQSLELEKGPPLFTMQEIKAALDGLVNAKVKNKRCSTAFNQFELFYDPKKFSLLPIGMDGQTTIHIYESDEKINKFIWGIYRLVNDYEKGSKIIPKVEFKKFKVLEFETKPGKKRKIVIPCLRDQVIIRCILNRLNKIGIIDQDNKPNQNIPKLTAKIRELIKENPERKIIRTDIKDFYPSVNTKKLLVKLQETHGHEIGPRLMALITKALLENKTSNKYTGLPVGMGTSVLFANYYISQLKLNEIIEGVQVIRYEDDLLLFIESNIDSEIVKTKLDEVLIAYDLKRNEEKTEILNCMSPFVFVGVSYESGNVSLSKERKDKWIEDVKKDINDEIRNYRTLEIVLPESKVPSRKEIVDMIWKEHKGGKRSYFYQHYLKIKTISESN